MRAVLCNAFGNPETLTMGEVDITPPAAGEVQVAVHAVGVNFPDILLIQGKYQLKPSVPFSPGLEFAGEVIALGEGVKHFQIGDRVLGIVNYGAYAEIVNASTTMLMHIPDNMPFTDAAAFAVVYGTSHIALTHRAEIKAGETLLVGGAAGGVGLTAVELGKLLGAEVIAAASTEDKLKLTRSYGAAHTINYLDDDVRERLKEITNGRGVDVVYDPVGGDFFDAAIRSIAWGGRLLVIGFTSGRIPEVSINRLLLKNASLVGVYWGAYAFNDPLPLQNSLQTLLGWYADGKLKPHISATYPLEQAADALHALMNRQSTGKIVLTVH